MSADSDLQVEMIALRGSLMWAKRIERKASIEEMNTVSSVLS